MASALIFTSPPLEFSLRHAQHRLVMGRVSAALMKAFKSADFVRLVEALTGIDGLHADPHNVGSGLAQILPNGSLQVHADNNHGLDPIKYARLAADHPLHGGVAERRVNLFLYLNRPPWESAWNGDLELWPPALDECAARILPLRNRLVLFQSTDFSFHGHPRPLGCALGRSRRSLAVYYYTRGRQRPSGEVDVKARQSGASTLYKQVRGRCDHA